MAITRGAIVLVALPGDFGKPRPAVVVQSDLLNAVHPTLVICPLTSDVGSYERIRLRVQAGGHTGIRKESEVMVDKISAVRREKAKEVIGHLNRRELRELDRALLLVLGLRPAQTG